MFFRRDPFIFMEVLCEYGDMQMLQEEERGDFPSIKSMLPLGQVNLKVFLCKLKSCNMSSIISTVFIHGLNPVACPN